MIQGVSKLGVHRGGRNRHNREMAGSACFHVGIDTRQAVSSVQASFPFKEGPLTSNGDLQFATVSGHHLLESFNSLFRFIKSAILS